jgi:hypothetical protein
VGRVSLAEGGEKGVKEEFDYPVLGKSTRNKRRRATACKDWKA